MGKGVGGAPARSIKARAIQLLAQREHSRVELRRKLFEAALAEDRQAQAAPDESEGDRPDSPDAATGHALARLDALLDWLEAHHYLSDQRFVESRVHARASRFGNLRIRQELAQHQVALSGEAQAALNDSELARARAVWGARFSEPPTTTAGHAKQARFLAGRGFSSEVVRQVLRELARSGGDDDSVETGND